MKDEANFKSKDEFHCNNGHKCEFGKHGGVMICNHCRKLIERHESLYKCPFRSTCDYDACLDCKRAIEKSLYYDIQIN